MQVAHFLEADEQPWAHTLAAAVIADQLQASELQASELQTSEPQASERQASERAVDGRTGTCESPWLQEDAVRRRLAELAPLGGTVDAVLRAARLPLAEQLPWTPQKWLPAVISSHTAGGHLRLTVSAAAACCDAMHAVRGVQSLTIQLERWMASEARVGRVRATNSNNIATAEAAALPDSELLRRACASVAAMPCLRGFEIRIPYRCADFHATLALQTLTPALRRLSRLEALTVHSYLGDDGAAAAALAPALGLLTTLNTLKLTCPCPSECGLRDAALLASGLQVLSALTQPNLWGYACYRGAAAVLVMQRHDHKFQYAVHQMYLNTDSNVVPNCATTAIVWQCTPTQCSDI